MKESICGVAIPQSFHHHDETKRIAEYLTGNMSKAIRDKVNADAARRPLQAEVLRARADMALISNSSDMSSLLDNLREKVEMGLEGHPCRNCEMRQSSHDRMMDGPRHMEVLTVTTYCAVGMNKAPHCPDGFCPRDKTYIQERGKPRIYQVNQNSVAGAEDLSVEVHYVEEFESVIDPRGYIDNQPKTGKEMPGWAGRMIDQHYVTTEESAAILEDLGCSAKPKPQPVYVPKTEGTGGW